MALKYTYNKDGSIKSAVTIPGSTTPFSRKEIAVDKMRKSFEKKAKSKGKDLFAPGTLTAYDRKLLKESMK